MKKVQSFDRSAGILMSVSSLPSPYGIGTFGKAAYDFVDFVSACNHRYWQVLPLGPTTYGDSPYQSYSAFAGNPYFIDLDILVQDGLLFENEVCTIQWSGHIEYVDYERIYNNRSGNANAICNLTCNKNTFFSIQFIKNMNDRFQLREGQCADG